jgi:transcriptional regulator with XRE-family HTH domain
MSNVAASPTTVGVLLQQWRKLRHLSQLGLAHEAEVSPRHVCFLETGRARPSREMVVHLAAVLDVPLRERNALLLAAGFAPMYPEAALDAKDLAPVRAALDAMLAHQEPYPAVILNRRWDIIQTNGAADRFFAFLLDGRRPAGQPNVLRAVFHPDGLRPWLSNWEAVAEALVERARREALGGLVDADTAAVVAEVLKYPDVPARLHRARRDLPLSPVIPLRFEKEGRRFAYFSVVATLGSPQDITAQEVRVECFFPADAETTANARALAD